MNVSYAFKLRKEIKRRADAVLASDAPEETKKAELDSLFRIVHPLNKYLEKQGYTNDVMNKLEAIIR